MSGTASRLTPGQGTEILDRAPNTVCVLYAQLSSTMELTPKIPRCRRGTPLASTASALSQPRFPFERLREVPTGPKCEFAS